MLARLVERRALRRDGAPVAGASSRERRRHPAVDPARRQARRARGGRRSSAPRSASSSRRTAAGAWWPTWRAPRRCSSRCPRSERALLVERFETRIFEKGDKLVTEGEEAAGPAPRRLGRGRGRGARGRRVASSLRRCRPATRSGEVALVLRRKANADVIAVHPTVTLFLPREEFLVARRTTTRRSCTACT